MTGLARARRRFTALAFGAGAAVVFLELFSLLGCRLIAPPAAARHPGELSPGALPHAETGFLWSSGEGDTYRPDPLLGYRFRAGARFGGNGAGPLLVSASSSFVKNGSAAADAEVVGEGEPVVVVTGGDAVAGAGLERNEDTIPSRLERWFRERCAENGKPRARIRVLNAGVPGYTMTQELSYYLFDLSYLHPVAWLQLSGAGEDWQWGRIFGSTEAHHNKLLYAPAPPAPRFRFLPATQAFFGYWLPRALGGAAGEPWRMTERPVAAARIAEHATAMIRQGDGAAGVPYYFFLQPTAAVGERVPGAAELAARNRSFSDADWDEYVTAARQFYEDVSFFLEQESNPRWRDLSRLFDGRNGEDLYRDHRLFGPAAASAVAEAMGKAVFPGLKEELCK